MAALIDALAKTVSLLTEIAISGAEAAFEKAKPTARIYLKSLIITTLTGLLLIPILVILKAVTGLSIFGYLAAFLAIIFTAILGLLYAPLGLVIGMLSGKTINPAEAGERYLKFIGPVIFAVLMASLYLARVPWERNAEALPVLIIAAAAVVLGSYIWGGWLSGRFYTFVAIVIMSLTTLSFFLPKVFETLAQKFRRLDTNMAELMGYREPDPVIHPPSGGLTFAQQNATLRQLEADELLFDEMRGRARTKAARDSINAVHAVAIKTLRAQLGMSDEDMRRLAAMLEKRKKEKNRQ
ncbi:MAG: hypothetical protein WAP55_00270 [Minisyncoccia bacterium]